MGVCFESNSVYKGPHSISRDLPIWTSKPYKVLLRLQSFIKVLPAVFVLRLLEHLFVRSEASSLF